MMKTYYLLLGYCLLITSAIQAQKHDNIWPMGYDTSYAGNACSYYMDFSNDSLLIVPSCLGAKLTDAGNAAISDSSGRLLFYTNGAKVIDSSHQLMLNGNNLNNCTDSLILNYGYPAESIILPTPHNDTLYHIFHIERGTEGNVSFYALHLHHSIVDMSLNNGLGAVTQKNKPIINDTLAGAGSLLEAVLHANGYDWWILIPENNSNAYYRFLLTKDSLYGPFRQTVGPNFFWIDYSGQAIFSPDGTLYARYDPYNEGELYAFDRCTGLLTHLQHIDVPSHVNSGGAAISPNSRFLYITNDTIVFQYDLQAADINASIATVAIYDGFVSFNNTGFWQMALAPDGKIYGVSSNTVGFMHVIESPDSAGLACNFRQHAVALPTYNGISITNFPVFRLAPIVCDTVSSTESSNIATAYHLYPNPAKNFITIEFSNAYHNLDIQLSDMNGRVLKKITTPYSGYSYNIDIQGIAPGFYILHIYNEEGKNIARQKIIIAP